jgi:hypothetical protein
VLLFLAVVVDDCDHETNRHDALLDLNLAVVLLTTSSQTAVLNYLKSLVLLRFLHAPYEQE